MVVRSNQEASLQEKLIYGAGTRAGLSLISASKTLAFMDGSEAVAWRHIEPLLKPCLRHRIKLTSSAYYDALTEDNVIDSLTENLKSKYKNLIEGF